MQFIIPFIISAATFVGLYNYLPLDLVTFNPGRTFGSTITTIQGSDTLSASRTVINTNFSNLNTDKFEISAWYATTSKPNLATVGTITSGTWNGTAIGVGYGGTGTTSPALNRVILGNASSGFKIVSGAGSSGEVLMSNGEGSAPSWQSSSVNQSLPYTWTAHHIFSSLFATNASTTNATTTDLNINSVNYAWPSTVGASSTSLITDANGRLAWQPRLQYLSSGSISSTNEGAYNTVAVPTETNVIVIYVEGSGSGGCGTWLNPRGMMILTPSAGITTESLKMSGGCGSSAPAVTFTASTTASTLGFTISENGSSITASGSGTAYFFRF